MQFHWPGFQSLKKLSTAETAELLERVAELTKSGLPLGPGLRAMADEMHGRRLTAVLRRLADRLDAGNGLVTAMESLGNDIPPHLRGLVLAGVRSGRLAEVLDEFVELQRSRMEMTRRVLLCLAYPFILLLFITALTSFTAMCLVESFEKIFKDFGTQLPFMTVIVIKYSRPVMWFFIGLVVITVSIPLLYAMIPGMKWLGIVINRIPIIGSLLRFAQLSQFSRMMAVLLEQKTALPDALRVTAGGLRDADLAWGCRCAAGDVENGRPLSDSMAGRRQFPPSLIPVVRWGQNAPALAESFRAATEMFEGRVRSQGVFMETMLMPIMLFVIFFYVCFHIIAMFLPLISLITQLSG